MRENTNRKDVLQVKLVAANQSINIRCWLHYFLYWIVLVNLNYVKIFLFLIFKMCFFLFLIKLNLYNN